MSGKGQIVNMLFGARWFHIQIRMSGQLCGIYQYTGTKVVSELSNIMNGCLYPVHWNAPVTVTQSQSLYYFIILKKILITFLSFFFKHIRKATVPVYCYIVYFISAPPGQIVGMMFHMSGQYYIVSESF